jgi:hypothetical protein
MAGDLGGPFAVTVCVTTAVEGGGRSTIARSGKARWSAVGKSVTTVTARRFTPSETPIQITHRQLARAEQREAEHQTGEDGRSSSSGGGDLDEAVGVLTPLATELDGRHGRIKGPFMLSALLPMAGVEVASAHVRNVRLAGGRAPVRQYIPERTADVLPGGSIPPR